LYKVLDPTDSSALIALSLPSGVTAPEGIYSYNGLLLMTEGAKIYYSDNGIYWAELYDGTATFSGDSFIGVVENETYVFIDRVMLNGGEIAQWHDGSEDEMSERGVELTKYLPYSPDLDFTDDDAPNINLMDLASHKDTSMPAVKMVMGASAASSTIGNTFWYTDINMKVVRTGTGAYNIVASEGTITFADKTVSSLYANPFEAEVADDGSAVDSPYLYYDYSGSALAVTDDTANIDFDGS